MRVAQVPIASGCTRLNVADPHRTFQGFSPPLRYSIEQIKRVLIGRGQTRLGIMPNGLRTDRSQEQRVALFDRDINLHPAPATRFERSFKEVPRGFCLRKINAQRPTSDSLTKL